MPRECWCHRVSQDKEPSPSQEEWKVEFVARFPKTPPEDFFIFIGDLLSQARASTLKEVEEWLQEGAILARIEQREAGDATKFQREMGREQQCVDTLDFISRLQAKKLP